MTTPSRSTIFALIRDCYGVQTLQAARYYVKTSTKIAKHQQHTAFNRRCRLYNVIPRCLQVKPLVRTAEGYRIAYNASRHFLGARIQGCHKETHNLGNDLYFQRTQLEFTLQPDHFQELEEHRVSLTNHVNQKSKSTSVIAS